MRLLVKNDLALHKIFGVVKVLENQSIDKYFIACEFMIGNREIKWCKLAVSGLKKLDNYSEERGLHP